ncbi:MAG: PAS domain S-box protein, partial [Bacteroidota bacterium]
MNANIEELKAYISDLEKKVSHLEKENKALLNGAGERHRLLWKTMTLGVVYQAASGDILSANPAAEKILGLTTAQMQGKTSMDPRWRMIEEDGTPVQGHEHPTMVCLQTGKTIGPVTRGVYHPEKDCYVWLSIISIPLFREGEEKPYQAYATFEDITSQKKARERLRKSEES